MKTTIKTILTLILSLTTVHLAHGAAIYTQDMEDKPVDGLSHTLTGSGFYHFGAYYENEGTAVPFGTPNTYARHINNAGAYYTTISSLTTYTWDIYEPTDASNTTTYFGYGRSADFNSTGAYVSFGLNDGALSYNWDTIQDSGSLPTLDLNTHYTALLLFNNSGSTTWIEGTAGLGGLSLDQGQVGLFFIDRTDNSFIDAGRYSNNGDMLPSAVTRMYTERQYNNGGIYNTLYYDNVSVQDTLTLTVRFAVPEPSSLMLLGVGSLMLRMVRRKRHAA